MKYRKTGLVLLLLLGLFMAGFTSINKEQNAYNQKENHSRAKKIHREIQQQIQQFRDYLQDSLLLVASQPHLNQKEVEHCFIKSRLLFKKFEWATSYFTADLTNRLNGPPVQEIENADLLDPTLARGSDPMGLQVIEELIYPQIDTNSPKALSDGINYLIHNTDYLIDYYADHGFVDWRILDAAKLEIFRIITLGITGYDASLCLNSIQEAAVAINSLRQALSYYIDRKHQPELLNQLIAAEAYLKDHQDFNSFDRAAFITLFANPVSSAIYQLEKELPGPKIHYNRLLNQDINTMFDSGAFNVNAFTPGAKFDITPAKVALGKRLFYDKMLSGTHTRNCASCHQPDLDYTDGQVTPADILDSSKHISRNAPTLVNAALQSNYFYDMRALTLEDQIRDVISNKHEMDGSLSAAIQYVRNNPTYKKLFAQAFPSNHWDNKIDNDQFTNALASYVRSLVKLNSRFDEYMQGKKNQLSQQEIRGFNLFMGKAKCGTCHFMPLFNGITPPKYIQSETEVLGTPKSLTDSTLDPDLGYYAIIGVDSYKYAFKIPTIRNISKTAPYMHNGVYNTLEEVMEFYNNAGAVGLGIDLPNQTLSTDSLGLSKDEQNDIIAFMKSLDSK
ncbi:cytochrome c peroxidase [Arachidicoccus rhizosphaerae]|uniref:Cytochrome c peroxidase n=1 Tax=Arachidicoccus rhizosphaerae TaxID=551991 RepID=A0A1H3X228_9BACT|nr:cytochrome c peroxidase [Arachidicoccus rhizosphaerae]SDZ93459.1 cytochrome c peroxidase [Arachidicoccus rhizosphaerae]